MKYGFKDGKNTVEVYSKTETDAAITAELTTTLAGYQAKALAHAATLAAASWTSQQQTVSVDDVTTSNIVIVSPAPASMLAYSEATVRCTAQGAGTLTFTCTDTPSADLTVNVLIL